MSVCPYCGAPAHRDCPEAADYWQRQQDGAETEAAHRAVRPRA